MAHIGFDYSWGRPSPLALQAAGAHFACRYVSYDLGKNLSATEAQALLAAGIAIVVNWESTATRADDGGFAGGVSDARAALAQARACGLPEDRPIYFSVDEGTTVGPNITAYFQGVASVLPKSRVGVYGGYQVVKGCLDAGLATWAWQTYAWSWNSQRGQVDWEPRAHIRQVQNGVKVGGADVDRNEAQTDDYGQWPAPNGDFTVAQIDDLKKYIDGTRDGMLKLLGDRLTQLENEIKFLTTSTGQRFDAVDKALKK
jgi:hypothetical protein